MNELNKRPGRTRILALCGGIVVAGAGALVPAGVASADSENVRNVVQEQVESVGESTGVGATSGPAVSINNDTIPQINVQVLAGDQDTRENSTQTATNTLNLEQTGSSATGDAEAEDGSTATSGPVTTRNIATGYQINVQVIAGLGCDVDQVASNTLDLTQDASATSGEANGTAGGDATSGTASAANAARVGQRNLQVYVCRDGATGEQIAENAGTFDQSSSAASGAANANGGSATTGASDASAGIVSNEANRQIVID